MVRITSGFLLIVTVQGLGSWKYGTSPEGTTKCGTGDADRCGVNVWSLGQGNEACAAVGTQSPINANFWKAEHMNDTRVTDLVLYPPGTPSNPPCAQTEIVVNQHTIKMKYPEECSTSYVTSWKGKLFSLKSFDYHSPSEHTLDGAYLPLEVQHVHKAADGQILIISVFATVMMSNTLNKVTCWGATIGFYTFDKDACERAQFFDQVLTLGLRSRQDAFDKILESTADEFKVANVANTTVNNDPYTNFIPSMSTHFYHYMGSTTTPPCIGNVAWIFAYVTIPIFDSSVVALRTMLNAKKGNQLAIRPSPWSVTPKWTWDVNQGVNNRPLQELGQRKFYYVGGAWDSAAYSSTFSGSDASSSGSLMGTNLSAPSMSSSESGDSDFSNFNRASGITGSGSSGFYIAVWKWVLLASCCCFCCFAAVGKPFGIAKPKRKARKTTAPTQKEGMPLLQTSSSSLAMAQPVVAQAYAPQSFSYAAPSVMSYSAYPAQLAYDPNAYPLPGYGQAPGYGPGAGYVV